MLWQSAHSEYYFCEVFWPAFRKVDFLRALRDYAARHRRYGVWSPVPSAGGTAPVHAYRPKPDAAASGASGLVAHGRRRGPSDAASPARTTLVPPPSGSHVTQVHRRASYAVAWLGGSREYPFQVDVRTAIGRRISAGGMGPSAREALCTTDVRADAHGRSGGPALGPRIGPSPVRSCAHRCGRPAPRRRRTPTSSEGVRPPVVTSKKRRDARPAHLCPRHQRAARRPRRHDPLRRARSRAAGRGGHGTGGQAAPSGARLLRPAGAAPAGRVPHPVRAAGRADPDRGPRRHRSGSSSTTPTPGVLPAGFRLRRQRLADPRRRPQPPGRGVRRHGRLQGPAAAHQGVLGRACSPRSTAPSWRSPTPAGPGWPS